MQPHEQKVEIPAVETLPATPSLTFKDLMDRVWTCAINMHTMQRVRDRLKVDLMEVFAPNSPLLKRLMADPYLLCDVLFVILEPQAQTKDVSEVQFAEGLGGDALDGAVYALIAGLFAFPRHQEIRAALLKSYQAQRALEGRTGRAIVKRLESPEMKARLEAVGQEIDQQIETALANFHPLSGAKPTAVPASSASTPAPSPSGS
jgi:hypothetical protein